MVQCQKICVALALSLGLAGCTPQHKGRIDNDLNVPISLGLGGSDGKCGGPAVTLQPKTNLLLACELKSITYVRYETDGKACDADMALFYKSIHEVDVGDAYGSKDVVVLASDLRCSNNRPPPTTASIIQKSSSAAKP